MILYFRDPQKEKETDIQQQQVRAKSQRLLSWWQSELETLREPSASLSANKEDKWNIEK